ncbi:putative ribonuclease H-like domain-containing protein [Rosa chinensis]|uniref:Putative ribonuclease H-like domain-containing protein n=2 Tax=Rosa chinensis TaxID=74649 RepID=A0A2P6RPH2_ROSCH|nr:putative ribonuclease H-like domain-containing protein [Rosa chinensis]
MTTRSGGLGVVIRDSNGTVVAGACGTCTDVASPVVVEALACRLACKVVVDNDLGPVMFKTDCLQVVQAICAEGEDTSVFGRIIDDISSLLSSLAGSFFSHVYRESNKLAHKVAKYALLSSAQVSWSGHVPPGLDGLFSTLCTR